MDKCYANSLGGCSGKISKEHYISEHLLRELGPIKAKGFHWLRGEEKRLYKILCVNPDKSGCPAKSGAFLFFFNFIVNSNLKPGALRSGWPAGLWSRPSLA
jgi:hypothetical protein